MAKLQIRAQGKLLILECRPPEKSINVLTFFSSFSCKQCICQHFFDKTYNNSVWYSISQGSKILLCSTTDSVLCIKDKNRWKCRQYSSKKVDVEVAQLLSQTNNQNIHRIKMFGKLLCNSLVIFPLSTLDVSHSFIIVFR